MNFIELLQFSMGISEKMHREHASGKGYADLVLIPRKNIDSPALVIELKYNKDAQAAISQIKNRNYPQKVAEYTGDIILVGINYDRDTKRHDCQIERWKKCSNISI